MDDARDARAAAAARAARAVFGLTAVIVLVQKLVQLHSWNWSLFDTRIYLDATRSTLWGTADLYAGSFGDGWPFTYPPFAVLAFAPLAAVPEQLATAALAVSSVLALLRICWLFAVHLVDAWVRRFRVMESAAPAERGGADAPVGAVSSASASAVRHNAIRHIAVPLVAALAVLLTAQSDAVNGTFGFGQVNLITAWLVVEDYLGARRARGVLIGLAAGVKVTPALAAVPRLLTREWPVALRSIAAGAATVALSAILLPHETVDYFTSALWDTKRPGAPEQEWNQSLAGFVARAFHGMPGASVIRVGLVLAALAAGMLVAAHLLRTGDALGAVLVVAVCTGSVSPISWYHHLVLLPLFALWAVAAPLRLPRAWHLAVATQAALLGLWVVLGLYQNVPRDHGAEFRHTLAQAAVSEAVPVLSLTCLVTLALALWSGSGRNGLGGERVRSALRPPGGHRPSGGERGSSAADEPSLEPTQRLHNGR